jgi:hypothetical protein
MTAGDGALVLYKNMHAPSRRADAPELLCEPPSKIKEGAGKTGCQRAGPREARPDDRLREAIHPSAPEEWIASSLRFSQ